MNIHNRIQELQLKRNWSINYMALQADLSPATVSGWFKKRAMPTIDGIQKICGAFGITVSEFFNETDTPPKHLTDFQQEVLSEFDLLHNEEKEEFLRLFKTINRIKQKSNPL